MEEAGGGDAELAFRALAAALNEEPDPLLVVFDDAHHGSPEVGALLADLTAAEIAELTRRRAGRTLPDQQRLRR